MSASRPTRMADVVTPIVPAVQQLARARPGTLSLAQGMVFFTPPPGIVERVMTRLYPTDARYGPVEGDEALREAYAAHLSSCHGYSRAGLAERLFAVAGANSGFLQAILTITSPGDEVILFTPFYFNHEMAIRIAGCTPRLVDSSSLSDPTLSELRDAIGRNTRAIVTVSPNNPTGEVLSADVLDAVNGLAAEHGLFHLTDEAYDELVFDDLQHHAPGARLGAEDHTIAFYSMSKSFGFAGFRLGCTVLPRRLLSEFAKVSDTNLICPPRVVQRLGTTLLEQWRSERLALIRRVGEQRSALVDRINTHLPDCLDSPSGGALYLWLRLPESVAPDAVVRELIETDGVAVLPGPAFVAPGAACPRLRVSFGGLTGQDFVEASERLCHGLVRITKR